MPREKKKIEIIIMPQSRFTVTGWIGMKMVFEEKYNTLYGAIDRVRQWLMENR